VIFNGHVTGDESAPIELPKGLQGTLLTLTSEQDIQAITHCGTAHDHGKYTSGRGGQTVQSGSRHTNQPELEGGCLIAGQHHTRGAVGDAQITGGNFTIFPTLGELQQFD
jgi:hypothetical protein